MSAQVHQLQRSGADWPQIPGYRLEAVLGRGSTGIVFRGVQLAVDRRVAVKVLHEELSGKPRIVGRLKREARTLARLHHPHLIGAIDMGEVNGRWWFAMEYVDGPTLADRIRSEGPLSEREALRLFQPLAEALVCLGDAGVVHRDVKPANILLERGPRGGVVRALLADLGLAFAEDDPQLTAQGGTLGTPHYISPEQAIDPSAVDARSDIWAFGATLFHALCGRPPFTGESMAEVLSAVLHARIPDPQQLAPHLGRGLALVVRKCLVREADGRYADARELTEDLERLRERRAPLVSVSGLDPLERRPGRFGRNGWIIAVAGVLALAGSSLVFFDPLSTTDGLATDRPTIADERALLDEILAQSAGESSRLAGAWREVEGLRQETSDEVWLPTRATLLRRIEDEIDRVGRTRGEAIDEALGSSGYKAARDLLELSGLEVVVRQRTGFRVEELPNSARGRLLDWRVERLDEVDRALADGVEAYTHAVRRYRDDVLLPGLARLVEAGSWSSALAETHLDAAALAARAGLDPAGLPLEELEAATLETRVRLATERVSIEGRWAPKFRALVDFIGTLAMDRERQARRQGGLPDELLDLGPAVDAELTRRGLDRAEFPQGSAAALEQARTEAQSSLAEASLQALLEAADEGLRLRADVVAPALLARRRYERAAELWRNFERELDPRVPDELVAAVRVERDLAERLAGILRRAAETVRARRGDTIELRSRNIGVSGELEAGIDPLEDGFRLRSVGRGGERSYAFDLRTLELGDLLGLCGFAPGSDPGHLAAQDRLGLALLFAAEGERDDAERVLFSGPLPDAAAAVVERLAQLVASKQTQAASDELLGRLDADLDERDLAGAAALIDFLLEERIEDAAVGIRSNVLRRDREALARELRSGTDRVSELAGRYPDARVEGVLGTRGRVVILGDAGRASLVLGGAWSRDATGAPAARSSLGWEELAGGAGLSLELAPPFDPAAGPWSVELELDFPAGRDPRAMVLCCGGFVVGWAGGEGASHSGWALGTQGEPELVARLAAGNVEARERGLRAGATHRLRAEWDRLRGVLRVYLDGGLVLRADRSPRELSERPRVELRVLDPVVVRSLEVEGPLR
ncbi:serine/threonine-protein kinase [Engelhardtia mirabilis]|uniref:Serine/threonine-protein kinase PrkC n=1 Tax=Engelhardtia mirabilis TaxID=2528011 RepID=A0A518BPJ5_9BACT|nr:Serine/threonine-protein kinase PrkC [Planctomycetes bacterium Pla133]QDV03231.1 Serine/threonine-protein kinase PrkC [Planctomycetes bacterium Pla86]